MTYSITDYLTAYNDGNITIFTRAILARKIAATVDASGGVEKVIEANEFTINEASTIRFIAA